MNANHNWNVQHGFETLWQLTMVVNIFWFCNHMLCSNTTPIIWIMWYGRFFFPEWMVLIEGWTFSLHVYCFTLMFIPRGPFSFNIACGTLFYLLAQSMWVKRHRFLSGLDEWCKISGYLFYSLLSLIGFGQFQRQLFHQW